MGGNIPATEPSRCVITILFREIFHKDEISRSCSVIWVTGGRSEFHRECEEFNITRVYN